MPTILLIEDEEGAQQAFRRTLKMAGYEVLIASEGKEGLMLLEKHQPDLVITDIFMDGMEGLETIRAIKEKGKDVPIIAISGSLNDVYLTMGKKFGATSSLAKPFNAHELLDAVAAALPEPEHRP